MTSRDELLRLAEWWESWGTQRLGTADGQMADKTAATIRELLAQEPVAHAYIFETLMGSGDLMTFDPGPWNGQEPKRSIPLYAAPVPAVDLETFKQEAMRLADALYYADDENDRLTKRAALAAHVDKLGGK
jgi:hypothetical protein